MLTYDTPSIRQRQYSSVIHVRQGSGFLYRLVGRYALSPLPLSRVGFFRRDALLRVRRAS